VKAKSRATLPVAAMILIAALAPSLARGATPKEAHWKAFGLSGPTRLPVKQSEVQRLTVEAQGGTFKLGFGAIETAALPFDASPAEVQAALEAIPALTANVTVSGGPGGQPEDPYFIAFSGALEDQDVAALTAKGEALTPTGSYAQVFTTEPGGPGTGSLLIYATNVGGAASTGVLSVKLGPLPAGIAATGPASGSGWSCAGGGTEVSCTLPAGTPPLSSAFAIKVPVEVTSVGGFSASAPLTLEEAGHEAITTQVPIVVSEEPAPPGYAAFWSGAFEADGEPSTQAGAHPFSQLTAIAFNTVRSGSGNVVPASDTRDIAVDLPAGFLGNPLAAPRCPQLQVSCGPKAAVGNFTAEFGTIGSSRNTFPINNDTPPFGAAAQFTFKAVAPVQSLIASVRSEDDFGIRVTAPNSATTFSKVYETLTAFEGLPASGEGKAFFRNPTDCAEEAREAPAVKLGGDSWQEPSVPYAPLESPQAPVTGCSALGFEPGFSFRPTTDLGSSPAGADAHLHIDQSALTDPEALAAPDLRRSVVKLPAGLEVNPAQADGLDACTEAQAGYKGTGALPNPTRFDNSPVSCPDASKLGSAEVTTPLLDEPLQGTIYLASQEANPFDSLIGLYLVFESPRFGVTLKLAGKVDVDPDTGRLTATFDHLPRQPVEDLTLHFRGGGPRSEFATPEVCGQYTTSGAWEPWSAPESGPDASTADSFAVSAGCSSSKATRPFEPALQAGTVNPLAGAWAPLVIKVTRKDGEQELRRLAFTLPEGLLGKLAGVPYCPESAIAAAEAKSGREEQRSPSCPEASRLGSVDSAAGVGPAPVHAAGSVYLAGPYEGAPLSAVVIAPAVSGPFDLGDVVVRSPLSLNEETARVTATSDPIPTRLRGIALKLRSVSIYMDRPQFTLNPTSCEASAVNASLQSSEGASATPSSRFQVGGCDRLPFKPKLSIRLKGQTRRGGHPALRVVLRPRAGDANLGSLSVAMPHSEFLANAHIRTVCTRVQFAAGAGGGTACPPGSVYGQVRATSPLVDYQLEGPLILRSSDHELPDLVAVLRGPASQPLAIAQVGRIDSIHGGIRTRFEAIPDAPISRVLVSMPAGARSLLENSTNLCAATHRAKIVAGAHNGLASAFKAPVKAAGCQKAKKRKHRHHRRGHRHRGS